MIKYGVLKEFTCRKGTIGDFENIISLAKPYIINPCDSIDLQKKDIRVLNKLTRFSIKHGTCVVCVDRNFNIVGVATQVVNNSVATLVSNGGIYATLLLYKIVFCDLHNRFMDSTFKVVSKDLNQAYYRMHIPGGSACAIDEKGNGLVKVAAKDSIETLYNSIKD